MTVLQDELSAESCTPEYEVRKIKTKGDQEYAFNFLVVDSPEKWPEASKATAEYRMPILGQSRSLSFKLRGLSLQEWEAIEIEHKIPSWTGEGEPTEDFNRNYELIMSAKRANVIELSSGVKLPGQDWMEKGIRLSKLNGGEVQALYYFIQNQVCAVQEGDLLGQYQRMAQDRVECDQVVEFNGIESWEAATNTPYLFRTQRPTEQVILEFPIRNLNSEQKLLIESTTRDPEVPKVPARDPVTKKWIPGQFVPDFNDEGWLHRSRAVNQKRTVLFFNACLPFTIPGKDALEQYEWISRRLLGDVLRLRKFIEEELCGYRSRYDFFTKV